MRLAFRKLWQWLILLRSPQCMILPYGKLFTLFVGHWPSKQTSRWTTAGYEWLLCIPILSSSAPWLYVNDALAPPNPWSLAAKATCDTHSPTLKRSGKNAKLLFCTSLPKNWSVPLCRNEIHTARSGLFQERGYAMKLIILFLITACSQFFPRNSNTQKITKLWS